MISLEARGVLQNKFKTPFRRQRPWQVDWSEGGNIEYMPEEAKKAVKEDKHEAD